MTLYIYEATEDDPQPQDTLVTQYEGESNRECEAWATEHYGDTDKYYWSYTAWTN